MGIDRETKARACVVIDYNKAMIKRLLDKNIDISGEDEHKKKPRLWIDADAVIPEEYYFDEKENTIHYTGAVNDVDGEVFLSVDFKLSDVILVDVLQGAIKKFNKMKTALESMQ